MRNIQVEWLYTKGGDYDEVRIYRPNHKGRYKMDHRRGERLFRVVMRDAIHFLPIYAGHALDGDGAFIDLF